jgi:hypothetical protein
MIQVLQQWTDAAALLQGSVCHWSLQNNLRSSWGVSETHKFYKQDVEVVNNKTGCTRNIHFNITSQLRLFLVSGIFILHAFNWFYLISHHPLVCPPSWSYFYHHNFLSSTNHEAHDMYYFLFFYITFSPLSYRIIYSHSVDHNWITKSIWKWKYRMFSNLIRTSFCRFLKRKKS